MLRSLSSSLPIFVRGIDQFFNTWNFAESSQQNKLFWCKGYNIKKTRKKNLTLKFIEWSVLLWIIRTQAYWVSHSLINKNIFFLFFYNKIFNNKKYDLKCYFLYHLRKRQGPRWYILAFHLSYPERTVSCHCRLDSYRGLRLCRLHKFVTHGLSWRRALRRTLRSHTH